MILIRYAVKLIIIGLLLGASCPDCYALDPSIYEGRWKTLEGSSVNIVLTIPDPHSMHIEINGQLLEHFEFDYVYGKQTFFPFLTIDSLLEKQLIEHYIYLVIGSDSRQTPEEDFNTIRGFYMLSKILDLGDGLEETTFYPIELQKVESPE